MPRLVPTPDRPPLETLPSSRGPLKWTARDTAYWAEVDALRAKGYTLTTIADMLGENTNSFKEAWLRRRRRSS